MPGRKRKAVNDAAPKARKRSTANPTPPTSRRITRRMHTDGPRQAVFNTAEMLEHILMCLPARQIFGVQRVSTRFRDLVLKSPTIQQKLFLELKDEPEEVWMLNKHEAAPKEYDGVGAPPLCFTKWTKEKMTQGSLFTPVRINPLFQMADMGSSENLATRAYRDSCEYVRLSPQAAFGMDSSLMDTYISNPYPTNIYVHFGWRIASKPVYTGYFEHFIETDRALTIGEMLKKALAKKGRVIYFEGRDVRSVASGDGTSVGELIKRLERETGRKAVFKSQDDHDFLLRLHEAVVPSDEEREEVEQRSSVAPRKRALRNAGH